MEKNEKTTEDYLEAMLMIKEKLGYIRSIDVAELLGVKKPSVTYATKRLKEKGYITMDAESLITFTDEGLRIATKTYERHKLLTKVFTMLGVSEEIARKDACRVEHDLSDETYKALEKHIEEYS
ncbi:MAG: metal-dependent transcriptional regulator [Eubacterium sp.]|nr:metal-dependent transcriptional regulator [Eubacterium sp.]